MDNILQNIQNAVLEAPAVRGIKIVGIDGPSGSGKSTLAGKLAPLLNAPVIPIDDFVSWNNFAGWWPRFNRSWTHYSTGARPITSKGIGRATSSVIPWDVGQR